MLDSNIYTKLEHDIENLQKDRDSVFHLDDEFYDKLVHIYDKNDQKQKPRRTTEVYENKETIDDVRLAESKEEDSSSESASRSEDSEENNSQSHSQSNSQSQAQKSMDMISEPSEDGIGVNNRLSGILSNLTNKQVVR